MTTCPREWEIRTRYDGQPGFDVAHWPYQRQAYRFVIDWFCDDPLLDSVELVDGAGHADTLTLSRKP